MTSSVARSSGRRTLFALAAAVVLGGLMGLTADVAGEDATRSTHTRKTPTASQSAGDSGGEKSDARLESKLDQILANQQTILQRFDQIMEELRIIKVRATLN